MSASRTAPGWWRLPGRRSAAAACALAVSVAVAVVTAGAGNAIASPMSGSANPVVRIDDGVIRGASAAGVNSFLGLPYAAPPTGNLRWRPPQPAAAWTGVRPATQFGPSCPQALTRNPFLPPGTISEDCLYLNVYAPPVSSNDQGGRPVLVWIHGGGLVQDGARNYDGTKLAAAGTVVVTINYRLGALGFLAHPALASRPGGPAGNYGLMDQQAALRWVRDNIAGFGGNPDNVTIAGESAGGLSVLAQLVSTGARGLFQKAIIESGSFALKQQPLADAEAAGEALATAAGCAGQSGQTAACLRRLPAKTLVASIPGDLIPGVVDGKVLTEPIGTAFAAGRFARVPILNGTNTDEERLFVTFGLTVSGGTDVLMPEHPVTAAGYQSDIAAVLGVPAARAAAIAAEYPPAAYPSPDVAFSALVGDANFACPALQIDQETSSRVPTYAYEFNDAHAPEHFAPTLEGPPVATHASEEQYLFDLPNVPFPAPLTAGQQALAASMRAAWANFAATGNPASAAVPWPAFNGSAQMLSLVPPQPQVA